MGNKRILIASGGTGGHVIPSQMLAQELRRDYHCKVSFCGKDLSRFFTLKDYPITEVQSASFFHKNPYKMCKAILQLTYGLYQSFRVLKKEQPDIVVGFGSYHSFPVLLAAYILRKPIVLFEPNTVLGRVNRFFAKRSVKLAMQFPLQKSCYHNLTAVARLPWGKRSSREKLVTKLDPKVFTFLIFGGSQGAAFLNGFFLQASSFIQKELPRFQVIHLTGNAAMTKEAKRLYEELDIAHYVEDFERRIEDLYPLVDLAICRAGANTIAELIQWHIPSLLIPYPYATEQHQRKNAEFLTHVVQGASFCEQKNLTLELFLLFLKEAIQDNRLSVFRKNLENYRLSESLKSKKKLSELIYEL